MHLVPFGEYAAAVFLRGKIVEAVSDFLTWRHGDAAEGRRPAGQRRDLATDHLPGASVREFVRGGANC